MNVYIVRLIDRKELVGVFWADTIDDLVTLVDECTDPAVCEYRTAHRGGFYWPGLLSPMFDDICKSTDLELDNYTEALKTELSMCESTQDDLINAEQRLRKWKQLPDWMSVVKKTWTSA